MVTSDKQGKGHSVTSQFQVADVTRTLWSVGLITDSGLQVTFSKDGAAVLDASGVELCHFARVGGLYLTTVKVENPAHPDFHRPGQ